MMQGPSESDWGYQNIARECPERAARLDCAGEPDALVESLNNALKKALANDVRIGFDGICNDLSVPRITIQFAVSTQLYDWFFSARTGYRAQYWISPDVGHTFNTNLLGRLRNTFEQWTACSLVEGREIWVLQCGSRIDKGQGTICRSTALASLAPELSKIWIGELEIQSNVGELAPLPMGMRDPKLRIPRWKDGGLLAPWPEEGRAWLDIKGGYVGLNGSVEQPKKSPKQRADTLHQTGWT